MLQVLNNTLVTGRYRLAAPKAQCWESGFCYRHRFRGRRIQKLNEPWQWIANLCNLRS